MGRGERESGKGKEGRGEKGVRWGGGVEVMVGIFKMHKQKILLFHDLFSYGVNAVYSTCLL